MSSLFLTEVLLNTFHCYAFKTYIFYLVLKIIMSYFIVILFRIVMILINVENQTKCYYFILCWVYYLVSQFFLSFAFCFTYIVWVLEVSFISEL